MLAPTRPEPQFDLKLYKQSRKSLKS